MNKHDFTAELAQRTGMPKAKAAEVTNAALDILTEAIANKETVQFIGFGSFESRYTPQRLARNPRTKEEVTIPAGYKPVFKASKTLRAKANAE